MKVEVKLYGMAAVHTRAAPPAFVSTGSLRSLTRAGRLEMLTELTRMCDEVENLASRERARGLALRPASDAASLVERMRPTAARWHAALIAGGNDGPARGELVTLHDTFSQAVQAARHNLEAHNA